MRKFVVLLSFCAIVNVFAAGDEVSPMLKLLDIACRENPSENILLSPFSMQQCFGMFVAGAGEKTAAELHDVMGVGRGNLHTFKGNIDSMAASEEVIFSSFNAAVVNDKYDLHENFIVSVKEDFAGEVLAVDFSRTTECVDMLNSLVKKHSKNMFDEVFSESDISGSPALMLLNVLYFKAAWMFPFDKTATSNGSFTSYDGDIQNAEIMQKTMHVPYYNNGDIHAVILPYKDPRFQLMLIMPVENDGDLEKVISFAASEGIAPIIRGSSDEKRTEVDLPKLELSGDLDLVPLLRQAGMKHLFDPVSSDLCGISDIPLYVDRARQLVKLVMNEDGTEMSAVTYAVARAMLMPPGREEINVFHADRPFAAILFDGNTETVLLAGAVRKL